MIDGLVTISSFSLLALGPFFGSAPADGTWSSANRCLYIPFRILRPHLVAQLWWENGTVVSGTNGTELAIYSAPDGHPSNPERRLITTGGTTQAGTSATQVVDVTDYWLDVGCYYFAMICDNTTSRVLGRSVTAGLGRISGCLKQATSIALPTTATAGQIAETNNIPLCGLTARAVE